MEDVVVTGPVETSEPESLRGREPGLPPSSQASDSEPSAVRDGDQAAAEEAAGPECCRRGTVIPLRLH